MSDNPSSRKDLKALIEQLRPFFLGLGLGIGLLVLLILLGLLLGLWSGFVPPGHDFAQPR